MREQADDDLHHREEAEDAPSLCDLAVNSRDADSSSSNRIHQSSSDFFEFFSDLRSSNMCSAEDVILCGKLIPFKQPPLPHQPLLYDHKKKPNSYHRRSESLSNLQTTVRSNSTNTKVMRTSRSLDCRKLHRYSSSMISPATEIDRNLSNKNVGKSDVSVKRVLKPRWYFLMFGMVKIPPEMMVGEMKSRQCRRNHSTLFSTAQGGKFPVNRSERKGSWRLLKVLSCKDHGSVPVGVV